MAANVLSWLPTKQTDHLDFDEDLPAYAVLDHHKDTDEYYTKKQLFLTIQQFKPAQQDDDHFRHLAKKADAPDSPFIYEEFGILSR